MIICNSHQSPIFLSSTLLNDCMWRDFKGFSYLTKALYLFSTRVDADVKYLISEGNFITRSTMADTTAFNIEIEKKDRSTTVARTYNAWLQGEL